MYYDDNCQNRCEIKIYIIHTTQIRLKIISSRIFIVVITQSNQIFITFPPPPLTDDQLVFVLSAKPLKNCHEHVFNDVQYFVVVLLDLHLHIEACEFSQVARSVRILSAEDRTDFKHTIQIGHNCHLFVQLRGLCEVSRAVEVSDSEYIRATLTLRGDQLRGVNLNESVFEQCLTEEETSCRLQFEDRLIGCSLVSR